VSVNGSAPLTWRVFDRRFKGLAPLTVGGNQIEVSAAGHTPLSINVTHAPRTAEDRRVRLVYLVTRDGSGEFQGFIPGEPHDLETALRRLRFNGRIVQSVYAEMMRSAGRGRKTFEFMQHDGGDIAFVERFLLADGDIDRYRLVCQNGDCVDGPEPYYSTYALWGEVNSWMEATSNWRTTKNLVYMSFTRFWKDEAAGRSILYGGGTLGGDHTATVHGTSLCVFPDDVAGLQTRLFDRRREADYGMNDIGQPSAEFWQAWAGALGGATHELGHSFGLGHASDPLAFMAGGFRLLNRFLASADGDESLYPENELPSIPLLDEAGRPHLDVLDRSDWLN
jgi:hypothetical protein